MIGTCHGRVELANRQEDGQRALATLFLGPLGCPLFRQQQRRVNQMIPARERQLLYAGFGPGLSITNPHDQRPTEARATIK